MRFKFISIFLVIQLFSFGLWSTFFKESSVDFVNSDQPHEAPHLHSLGTELTFPQVPLASVIDVQEAPVLEKESLPATPQLPSAPTHTPHFAAKNMQASDELINPIHQDQIEQVLQKLPQDHVKSVQNIILDYDPAAHRGLGGGGTVILRGVNMEQSEFVGVLVHEMSHNVDSNFLMPTEQLQESRFSDGSYPIFVTDPSLEFYQLSWAADGVLKPGMGDMDFVSGYAMADHHEDFAETYAYYVLHGKDFRVLTAESEVLLAKYNFMKDVVFRGQEFQTGDSNVTQNSRPWDVTVLPYDTTQFL